MPESSVLTETLPEALRPPWQALARAIGRHERLAVAFSGGVDSSLLLCAAGQVLGPTHALGILAQSETLTPEEANHARALAERFGWRLHHITYSELEIPNYAENPVNRCYFCKSELFDRLRQAAAELGFDTIAEGTTADDLTGDYRPGAQAARERGVVSPLAEAGLPKQTVRRLARALGLPNWDKPAGACLSSRFPYGTRITRERLDQVARAEDALRRRGFAQLRVRWHDSVARIECDAEGIARLGADPALREEIVAAIRETGFQHVALDLLGYRTGSLNEGLGLMPGENRQE